MNIMHKALALFILLICYNWATSQNIDSVLAVLHNYKKQDYQRLQLLNTAAERIQYITPKKGIALCDSAVALAEKLNNESGQARAYALKGENYLRMSELDTARLFLNKALAIYQKTYNKIGMAVMMLDLGKVKALREEFDSALALYNTALALVPPKGNENIYAKVYAAIGSVHMAHSELDEALSFFNKGLDLVEKNSDLATAANLYAGMADVYLQLPDYPKSLDFRQKAIALYQKMQNKRAVALALANAAPIETVSKNYDIALSHLEQALKIFTESGDSMLVAGVLWKAGQIFNRLGNYQKTFEDYDRALSIYEAINRHSEFASLLNDIGFAHYTQGTYSMVYPFYKKALYIATRHQLKYPEGIIRLSIGEFLRDAPDTALAESGFPPSHRFDSTLAYLQSGYAIGKQLNNAEIKQYAYQDLGLLYEKEHNYRQGLDYYRNYIAERDSISNAENDKKITKLNLQYEFDRKSDSIKLEELAADAKLKQQMLLGKQQQQQLELEQKELKLDSQEKNLQKIAFQKNQADLRNEQLQKKDREKEVALLQNEKALQESDAERERYTSRVSIYGLLALLGFLFLTAILLWRNNLQKQKANAQLLRQEHETGLQKEKVEKALAELTATQNQLIQSEKMASLGELTAGIAHEIQNPLNFVNNFSEVSTELLAETQEEIGNGNMQNAKQLLEELSQNMQKINLHGSRADNIVKAMLQHSRAANGKKEMTDINALAAENLRLSYHGFSAKDKTFNATMKTILDENLPPINVAAQDIARVLLNLFNNAFYAVSEKARLRGATFNPTVLVTTQLISTAAGRYIELRVRDNGLGIPSNVIDKIFQPFFTTKPTGQGTGLGLSLSYDIITKGNGGQLTATTKEGEYAEFLMRLPFNDKKI